MRNSFFYLSVLIYLTFTSNLVSQELKITSSEVQYDNINKITVFKGGVSSTDQKGNKLFSEYIKYDKLKELIETKGDSKIITSAGYEVFGTDMVFNNNKNVIYSNNKTQIIDRDGNNISVDMFNYSILSNIFF